MCGTGRSAPNSLKCFYLMRMGFFMAHFYLYRSVMVLLRTMSIQALQTILHDIMYWCVFYFDTILLIVVLLILWKIFWEMS